VETATPLLSPYEIQNTYFPYQKWRQQSSGAWEKEEAPEEARLQGIERVEAGDELTVGFIASLLHTRSALVHVLASSTE
jgi:hypothetical protein